MKLNEYKVLLIDDDEDDFIHIRDILNDIRDSKYHVTWKSTYEEGLKNFLHDDHDICLLDYRLGEKNGLDFLRDVQKRQLKCPIIFLTGHSNRELDLQAMQIGASDYLVKDQISSLLLERAIRYSMKHAFDMEELRQSKAQILQQDRLASLGLLASSLAHEIGTPLGIIRSRAEMAIKKTEGSVKQDLETVVLQIDRIAKLVNSLLNLAREKKSEHVTAISLHNTMKDVLNLVQHELERKNIELALNLGEDITVKAEAAPLGQVLLNLLVNSIHAIEAARKTDSTKKHSITITATSANNHVDITFADTGCGIEEKNMSQIFKPFFTTKDIGSGTGLGLATSYKIVQSWGGVMTVESVLNQGTSFKIKLPKR